MNETLAIYICYENKITDKQLIDLITYGIEEEGIPCHLKSDLCSNFKELAIIASNESQLDVGIGIDAAGNMCLHHSKLPDQYFLFESNHQNDKLKLRNIGVNGARLVKGIPFVV
ncbi:MAG: glycerol dehydratase [Firmicutes bacterium HGW-Firmicutes-7]|nr:MAG: glycerol dehydratase [Firmicutes bacterium HGW-Firmicutes-7]